MEEYGYNLTADLIRKSKGYGMADVHYLIYADLRACGWSMRNAWNVAFNGRGASWAKDVLEKEMNRLESLDSVQNRIEELQGKRTQDSEGLTPEELAKETSKEKLLADLVLSRRKHRYGSKEWTEDTKLIAEYARIKHDDLQTEDTTVHFYIPARYPTSYKDCLLYKNGLCKHPKQDG